MKSIFQLLLTNKSNSFVSTPNLTKLCKGKSYANKKKNIITLDIESDQLLEEFKVFVSSEYKIELAENISNFLKQSKEIEDHIKSQYQTNSYNAYDFILDTFSIWYISKLHMEGKDNAIVFLNEVPLEYDHSLPHLYDYPKLLLKVFSLIDCSLEEIESVIKIMESSESQKMNVGFYFDNIAEKNTKQAKSIFKYLISSVDFEQKGIKIGKTLSSLYRYNESVYAFSQAIKLFKEVPLASLVFFETIPIQSKAEIEKIMGITESINSESLLANSLCLVYSNILNSQFVDEEIARNIFNKFQVLFKDGGEDLRNSIVYSITFRIREFEAEKYDFLRIFISQKAMQLEEIRMYFHDMKDTRYFFNLYCELINNRALDLDTSIFEDVFRQYWNQNRIQTSEILFSLLSEANIYHRFLGVKLILSYEECTPIDFNNGTSEIDQLRIIEACIKHPHSIDRLLSSLLLLRNSKFKSVKSYLQKTLSELVFDVYNQFLYDKIVSSLMSSKADKKFLEPISKAMEKYNEIQKMKSKYKDLDPFENEKKYIELYFGLEYEIQAKMMAKIQEKSFLRSIAKTNIIVRGNAWKLEDNDEVMKLGTYSHSISFDTRAFKNPEFFEYSLQNLTTEFP